MSATLVWQLAWRYLRGKRSGNAVPILSRISMAAIAIGAGSLIILFSVFNGFEGLVKGLYKSFYPDIRITPTRGKFFLPPRAQLNALKKLSGVRKTSMVIEDMAFAGTDQQQQIITLKGIDANYLDVNNIRPYIVAGVDSVSMIGSPTVLTGLHIANELGADVNNAFTTITIFYPDPNVVNPSLNPAAALRSILVRPVGAFRIQEDFDSKYMLAPLAAAQQLFAAPNEISAIELSATEGADIIGLQKSLKQLFGPKYKVKTRYELNKTLYMVMHSEKWVIYAILVFVLVIASFNMIGALSLLVISKQRDIAILKAMGASNGAVRAIFLFEGLLWAIAGAVLGISVALLLCLGQQHYKWIKLEGAFMIDAYPVQIQLHDIGIVLFTIVTISLLASLLPSIRASRAIDPALKST